MFRRILNTSKSNSFFVFGARGTGKTTFVSQLLRDADVHRIDLLNQGVLAQLEAYPEQLGRWIGPERREWVLIDEVQKVPALLDEVHRLIEAKGQKFILTGSSARKLKRNAANLLAGRAFVFKLFPLTAAELGSAFDLGAALSYGTLPKISSLSSHRDKVLFLKAYADTYLREEIQIEQLIRKLPPFRKFLEIAARQDTELTSYTNIARDILVDPKVVSNYYEILEETLLGFRLEPFDTSIRKRQRKTPKFYWFDTGVRRALAGTVDDPARSQTFEYGSLFESFVVNEFHRRLTYAERTFRMSFLRVDERTEIDLIIERPGMPTWLIEIKSTERVHEGHTDSLRRLAKEFPGARAMVASLDMEAKEIDGVSCRYWQVVLGEVMGQEFAQ